MTACLNVRSFDTLSFPPFYRSLPRVVCCFSAPSNYSLVPPPPPPPHSIVFSPTKNFPPFPPAPPVCCGSLMLFVLLKTYSPFFFLRNFIFLTFLFFSPSFSSIHALLSREIVPPFSDMVFAYDPSVISPPAKDFYSFFR